MVRRFVATGGLGMKGVDTIARIRREHFVRGKSIKEIVRELHVSRNTVRKVLRTGATAFSYEREVQPLPRLGPWREALDGLLAGNEGKPARERLTLIRIFEELRGRGYEGSYDALRRYAKGWRRAQATMTAAAYVPLSFAPGEAYQFDWSHEIVLINGTTVSVRVAHVRLCHSRMPFVRAYPRETQEMVFDAHAVCARLTARELNVWLLDQCIAYAKGHPHPERREETIWQAFEAERPALVPYAGRFDGFCIEDLPGPLR